jgi:hypothetical protein
MTQRYTTWFIVLAGLSCGPYRVPGPIVGGPDATIGCYHLSLGPWAPGGPMAKVSAPPPKHIRLYLTRQVTPPWAVLGLISDSLPGTWHLVRTDSLILEWSKGMAGAIVTMGPEGDSLVGNATAWFQESGGFRETVVATAMPVKCS